MNGIHCSEDKELLEGIVRGEWEWDGLIMSDWTGVYSVDQSVKVSLFRRHSSIAAMLTASVPFF